MNNYFYLTKQFPYLQKDIFKRMLHTEIYAILFAVSVSDLHKDKPLTPSFFPSFPCSQLLDLSILKIYSCLLLDCEILLGWAEGRILWLITSFVSRKNWSFLLYQISCTAFGSFHVLLFNYFHYKTLASLYYKSSTLRIYFYFRKYVLYIFIIIIWKQYT